MMLADLHTHSTFSDGRYTPTQLVQEAVRSGIAYLAVTDHDSWNGVEEAKAAAASSSIKIIPGIELGTQYAGESVHILGYYVDTAYRSLQQKMDELRHARERRLYAMLEKLASLGYYVEVEACDPKNRAVGRPHVAKALVAKGYFKTVQDVFDALLKKGAPAYVPQPKLSPEEAVRLIHAANGIAVLAHPSEITDKNLPELLLRTVSFDGIEAYHPSAAADEREKWLRLAAKYKLLVSGGSDFHGIPDRFPARLGIFKIDSAWIQDILNYQ